MTSGKNGHVSIPAREDDDVPTELGRLLAEALLCLEALDLSGANAALKQVYDEAALSREGATPGSRRNGERA